MLISCLNTVVRRNLAFESRKVLALLPLFPFFLLLALLTGSSLSAAAEAPDPLFSSPEPFALTLTAPFARIDRERDKEQEYVGTLSYVDESGAMVVMDVDLEIRGNWRLRKANCNYSQLWVDLKRRQTEGTIFANQNRLKLVVQCRRQDRYAEYLIREKQAYQMFERLSEIHFDTRLVNATYTDSERDDSSRTHLAFFIEHQNRMAERMGLSEVELNSVNPSQLDPDQTALVSLFMYLLGNTDFSLSQAQEGEECCHNAKLLQSAEGSYFPVPYDFDASGFVDASYAPEPAPRFRLRNNRQRIYRGYCLPRENLDGAIARFQSLRQELLELLIPTELTLSRRSENRAISYLEDFYEVLDDPNKVEREIVNDCL